MVKLPKWTDEDEGAIWLGVAILGLISELVRVSKDARAATDLQDLATSAAVSPERMMVENGCDVADAFVAELKRRRVDEPYPTDPAD